MTVSHLLRAIRSTRTIAGVTLVLILVACTGPTDPLGSRETGGGRPTGTGAPDQALTGYTDDLNPGPDLYGVDPQTGEAELIFSAGEDLHEPERSPTGPQIVYQGTELDGTTQIFVLEDGDARQLTDLEGGAWEPTWSPDGSRIAFAGVRSAGENSDIFVMDADGRHLQLLARTPRFDRAPDWSPDGTRVVFVTDPGWIGGFLEDGAADIWVASVDEGAVTRLTRTHRDDEAPMWSPDGRLLLFTRYGSTVVNEHRLSARLWLMRADGTARRPLMALGRPYLADELQPTWSPDGRSIAFSFDCSCIRILELGSNEVRTVSVGIRPRNDLQDLSWGSDGIIGCWGCSPLRALETETRPAAPAGVSALPPERAEPSEPAVGDLVARFVGQNVPGCGWCQWFVYADGRVVTLHPAPRVGSVAYREQRLSPRGVELLEEAIRSSPLVTWDRRHASAYNYFMVQLFGGDRVGTVNWVGKGLDNPRHVFEDEILGDFYGRMLDLASWLPRSAWVEARYRPFVPSRYLVSGEVHPAALPPPADALLRPRTCQLVTTDEAREILAGFDAAGLDPTADGIPDPSMIEYVYPRNRGVGYFGFEPALPSWTRC